MFKGKILVTGSNGFVGKNLIEEFVKAGYQVAAYVRQNSDCSFLEDLGVTIIRGGLTSDDEISHACQQVDAVIHLASAMKGPWQEYEETTVKGTQRLLKYCLSSNIQKFIYISSISVYDLKQYTGQIITEDSPISTQDVSFYEKSKIQAEEIVEQFIEKGLPAVILRPGIVYGPKGSLYPSRLGFALGKNRALVIGNGTNAIPLVYVKNLIDCIKLVLESDKANGQTYQIIDDQKISQNEYLKHIKEQLNPDLSVIRINYRIMLMLNKIVDGLLSLVKKKSPFRPIYCFACKEHISYSNQKARDELNWSSKIGFEQAINETMKYHQSIKKPHSKIIDWNSLKKDIWIKQQKNVAIIGCGIIAKTHLDILKKIHNVNVVGLVDPNLDMAKQLSSEYGHINTYDSIESLLDKEKVDVVHVLTPPQTRKSISLAAIEKGCDILLEKPMALNALDATIIVQAALKKEVNITINHNHVYDPVMIRARKLINDGVLGKVINVDSWYGMNLGSNLGSRYMVAGAEHQWALQIPGKLYQNIISHPLSVLLDVLGTPEEIKTVATSSHCVKAMKTDELKSLFKSKDIIGTLHVSMAVSPRYQHLHVYGTKASLFVDFLNKTLTVHTTPKMMPKAIARALFTVKSSLIQIFATVRNFILVLMKKFTYYDGTEILIKEFYLRLDQGEEMPITVQDGILSMEVMDKIWKDIDI